MPRILSALLLFLLTLPASASDSYYDIVYHTRIQPDTGVAHVEIQLRGRELPRRLTLNLASGRYSELRSAQPLDINGNKAVWTPKAPESSLSYQFAINHKRPGRQGAFDSMITEDWAILRSDKLIPPISVLASAGLQSRASLELELPRGWSSALPYPSSNGRFELADPGRRFIRPKGWMILGDITSRQDTIEGVDARVAGPRGQDIRVQDTLAFLNWNLPHLKAVFPGFPTEILIVRARDPMWRGGLSGPNSLFMHGDRPLVNGDRTSTLIHELVHVTTGISSGDRESDWIVEGLAEYYTFEILRRSGGISERRYRDAVAAQDKRGRAAPSLLVRRSHGDVTARAAGVMRALDAEIRNATGDRASLDDVARALAEKRGKVTLASFTEVAEGVAGGPLASLSRERISGKKKP